jgi:hypothetical protein
VGIFALLFISTSEMLWRESSLVLIAVCVRGSMLFSAIFVELGAKNGVFIENQCYDQFLFH